MYIISFYKEVIKAIYSPRIPTFGSKDFLAKRNMSTKKFAEKFAIRTRSVTELRRDVTGANRRQFKTGEYSG